MSHRTGISSLSPLAPQSPLYQGPFGRLFPDLAAWSPRRGPSADPHRPISDEEADALLAELADTITERPGRTAEAIVAAGPGPDTEFDSGMPAGYTYFGQFVDHDITFDPASSLQRATDPNGLLNFRTPRLDLDCIYGRGPGDQPYLYDQRRDHAGELLVDPARDSEGNALCVTVDGEEVAFHDLPRNSQGRALIGDMRNDENAMVSQLQLAFLMAHNALVERARERIDAERAAGMGAPVASENEPFERARRTLRWLYQHVFWFDFVQRVCDPDVWEHALHDPAGDDAVAGRKTWATGFGDVYSWRDRPFIPIEFSVAAYRFGHTLVRNSYRTNASQGGKEIPIFALAPDGADLHGFRPMGAERLIQWDRYLPMGNPDAGFPQRARRFDALLSNSLSALDEDLDPSSFLNRLAFRNLKRGWRMGLPSGTAVAKALGVEPIAIPADRDALWLYILTEAQEQQQGRRLGTVGSMLVASTFAGLLKGDPTSWVNQEPGWMPGEDSLLWGYDDNRDSTEQVDGSRPWTLASIIRIAGVPVADAPFVALGAQGGAAQMGSSIQAA
ncbi:peroxidase family protein [Demequina salsinemoris]|uniref:peroxidase family protein n=1 Tax=Demequina salsinemoris TaxID=577470 RepID=UPI000782E578|nr:peroxidase family protein [Demequina salsinemoris]